MGYTKEKLVADLRNLGLVEGDCVLVHSAFRTIGANSPEEVIAALEGAVGPAGTVLMPVFAGGSEFFMMLTSPLLDIRNSKSDCGLITEHFRRMPGTIRSMSPGHTLAGRGPRAAELLADHEKCTVSAGPGSPFEKLIAARGKILLLGVGHGNDTTLHYIENTNGAPTVSRCLYYPRVRTLDGDIITVPTYPHMPGLMRVYTRADEPLDKAGAQTRGTVGNAEARLVDAFAMNEIIGALVRKNPMFLIDAFCGEA